VKKLAFLLVFAFMFVTTGQAYAASFTPVKEFGYDWLRNRNSSVAGEKFTPVWKHESGVNFSQPLILPGDDWGGEYSGKKLVVTVEGNTLHGYVDDDNDLISESDGKTPTKKDLWSVQLSGYTASHPTYVKHSDGRKFIYIGTYTPNFDTVEITNFKNVNQSNWVYFDTQYSTDITSAPLVINWKGHEIVVCTSGNSGKVFLLCDIFDNNKRIAFCINVGAGRTSSSPAPVWLNEGDKTGFAVGLDGGFGVYGELRLYYFEDILGEDGNGQIITTSFDAAVAKSLPSGLAASFSVAFDDNGDEILVFGDTQSRVYKYNVKNGVKSTIDTYAGTFSNRSPAMTTNTIYFPATGYAPDNEGGKLLAYNRFTGESAWEYDFTENKPQYIDLFNHKEDANPGDSVIAQTAPVVMASPAGTDVIEGTSNGYIVLLDATTGKFKKSYKVTDWLNDGNTYALGVSGELSAVDNLMAVGTQFGTMALRIGVPGNLKVTSLDTGVPDGQKAKPGAEYTATVVFENEDVATHYVRVPLGLFHDDYLATLYDETGQPLEKVSTPDGDYFVSDFGKKGDPNAVRTFTAKWHPSGAAKDSLTACVNYRKVPKVIDETTYEDNVITREVSVKSLDYDIKVLITPGMNPWSTTDKPADMWATVEVCRKDSSPEALPIKLTIDGAGGTIVKEFTLAQGSCYTYEYHITTSVPGNYNIEAQAWPSDGSWEDIYPPDNTASATIQYIYNEPPKPLDSKVRGGLVGTDH